MDFSVEQLKVKNLRTEDLYAYTRVHLWVNRQLGKASYCSVDKTHKANRYHWSNISGEYKRDLSDYRSLCPSCHGKLDYTDNLREIKRLQAIGNSFRSKPVYCIEQGNSYVSVRAAARSIGILATSINNCLMGRTKTAGGYHWQYKEG